MDDRTFVPQVTTRLRADEARAEGVAFAVLQELRDRLPATKVADMAAQLPTGLRGSAALNEVRDGVVQGRGAISSLRQP